MKIILLWIAVYVVLAGSSVVNALDKEVTYREIRDHDGKTAYTIDCSDTSSN